MNSVQQSILAAPMELACRNSKDNIEQPYRTMFMRDRDRILYSRSFRRLTGKTQVYASGSGDHRRNRLTHTLEVSQIARTIARGLGLDVDLTEAIALGHDIGHTPFGHAGERILHEIMSPHPTETAQVPKNSVFKALATNEYYNYMDFYGFKHNFQSVRAAIRFESNYGINGLDLTNYTLWGIQFHSSSQYKSGRVSTEHLSLDFYKQYDIKYAIDGDVNKPAWSFEAFVVREADEIAQRHHDLEDAIRSGVVSRKEVNQLILKNIAGLMNENDYNRLIKMKNDSNITQEAYISFMSRIVVNTLVNSLIESSKKNLEEIIDFYKVNSVNAYEFLKNHKFNEPLIANAIDYVTQDERRNKQSQIKRSIENFQKTMTEKILNSYDVQRIDSKGKYIIRKLFEAYYKNPQQLPDYAIQLYLLDVGEYKTPESIQHIVNRKGIGIIRSRFVSYHAKNLNEKASQMLLMRVICDHIAGMTDNYAISEYKALYG